MIINGKKISQEIVAALAARRGEYPPVIKLGVVMGAQDSASASFVKIKERLADQLQVVVVRELLAPDADTAEALRAVERLAAVCAGVIVQLPLPKKIEIDRVLAAVPPEKDVDAINSSTPPAGGVRAPVAEAVAEIFSRAGVAAASKKAAVVGAGRLVGAPAANLLRDIGAKVTVITQTSGSLAELKDADIVVCGAGEPGLVKPAMLKEGVALIDAGTSEQAGKVAGDADPRCAEVASVFTPVPGGVGPIAVAMIFKNLFALAKTHK